MTPKFLKDKGQFSKKETEDNKTSLRKWFMCTSLCIQVETLMGRLINLSVFDHKIPISLAPIASDILIVVAAMSNFHPPWTNYSKIFTFYTPYFECL